MHLNRIAALAALSLALGACGTKHHVEDALKPGPVNTFSKPSVDGPAVEGRWISDCHANPDAAGTREFDVTFTGDHVVRKVLNFSDDKCVTATTTQTQQGPFHFIEKYPDDSYAVEYAFDVGHGITALPQERLALKDGALYLSNFTSVNVLADEPLHLVGGQAVAPQPLPGQDLKAADVATNYSEMHYIYCANQGMGIMLDLGGVDISTATEGTAKMGVKACNSGAKINWSQDNGHFKVTIVNGAPQIDLTGGDYIRAQYVGQGLDGHNAASSLIGGNSGQCFFLKNDGTQGLPGLDCE